MIPVDRKSRSRASPVFPALSSHFSYFSHFSQLSHLTLLALLLATAAPPAPAAPPLPLAGELRGALKIAGDTTLPWQVTLVPLPPPAAGGGSGGYAVTATLRNDRSTGEDTLEVIVTGTLDASLRSGAWRVASARVDLGAWWPVIRAQSGLGATLADWSAQGSATLAGEGVWQDGRPQGRVTLRVENARFFNLADAIEIDGVTLDVTCEDLQAFALPPGQRLAAARITAAGAEAKDAVIEFGMTADRTVRVTRAEVAALGGSVRVAPFAVDLASAQPRVSLSAEVGQVSLADLARLVPEALRDAQGRLGGNVGLTWSASEGVRVTTGGLRVERETPAMLRMAAQPGFFTGNLPARFELLRFLGKSFSVDNPAWATLRSVEMGDLALQVESLDVTLMPDGPDGVRTAEVAIRAYPANRQAVKVITFRINVAGPLARVLGFGLDSRVSMKAAAAD
ncbi:Dicarboxylate transport [Opitutaceae bacterium TAV1]|nr:Dicarboxylate transport [Opitutaceae bacterium TAV1]